LNDSSLGTCSPGPSSWLRPAAEANACRGEAPEERGSAGVLDPAESVSSGSAAGTPTSAAGRSRAILAPPTQTFFALVGPPPSAPTSNQHWGTPRDFLDAVERRFGKIGLDLAAKHDNHVAPAWFGPGSPFEIEDTLSHLAAWDDWIDPRELRWLNPEFAFIDPYAAKCAAYRHLTTTALLTPASIGTEWFREHVHGKALVLGLSPRIQFVGADEPYNKDLMLSVFGPLVAPGFDCWRWRP
jgi:hypothetical protein